MNDLDFSFDVSAWELTLEGLQTGGSLSAARFLTLLEGEDETEAEAALQDLIDKHITLDISDLPKFPADGEAAARLRREEQLAQSGDFLLDLEENDPLRLYLKEVAQIPVAGDPAALAMELAAGDERVIPRLVNLMLSQAIDLSREYVGRGVLLLDLIQEASLGLWRGIQSYTGGDFKEHCRWWIRQYLAGTVTLQAKVSGVGQKLRRAMEDYRDVDQRLLTELGRNPTLEEIALELHMSPEEAATLEEMLQSARVMRQAKEEPETQQEEDQAVEDTAYFQMRQRIAELLSALSQQDAELLTLRYGLEGELPMKPQQVAARLGITAEEVVTREAAALAKLRQQS